MILFFSRSLNLLLYSFFFFFYSTGRCIGCICVALAFKYRLLNRNFSWSCVHYIMLHSSALNLKSGWRNLQNRSIKTKVTQLGSAFLWCCFIMECARAIQRWCRWRWFFWWVCGWLFGVAIQVNENFWSILDPWAVIIYGSKVSHWSKFRIRGWTQFY